MRTAWDRKQVNCGVGSQLPRADPIRHPSHPVPSRPSSRMILLPRQGGAGRVWDPGAELPLEICPVTRPRDIVFAQNDVFGPWCCTTKTFEFPTGQSAPLCWTQTNLPLTLNAAGGSRLPPCPLQSTSAISVPAPGPSTPLLSVPEAWCHPVPPWPGLGRTNACGCGALQAARSCKTHSEYSGNQGAASLAGSPASGCCTTGRGCGRARSAWHRGSLPRFQHPAFNGQAPRCRSSPPADPGWGSSARLSKRSKQPPRLPAALPAPLSHGSSTGPPRLHSGFGVPPDRVLA